MQEMAPRLWYMFFCCFMIAKLSLQTSQQVTVEGQFFHKSCFKCSHGGCSITPSNYAALDGVLYCKHHFSQLFREKGSYAHIMRSASIKREAAPVPEVVEAPAPEA